MDAHHLMIMMVPAIVALIGGVLAALWSPSHQMRSLIQHFAAGVVFSRVGGGIAARN